jgi:hypothetical protein
MEENEPVTICHELKTVRKPTTNKLLPVEKQLGVDED